MYGAYYYKPTTYCPLLYDKPQTCKTTGKSYYLSVLTFCPSEPYAEEYYNSQYCSYTNSFYFDKKFNCPTKPIGGNFGVGAIAGVSVGGAIFIALVIFLIIYGRHQGWCCKPKPA
jgi:hypothetical protein